MSWRRVGSFVAAALAALPFLLWSPAHGREAASKSPPPCAEPSIEAVRPQLTSRQLPTGILLDAAGVHRRLEEQIAAGAPGLSYEAFTNAYGAMERAAVRARIPDVRDLARVAAQWNEDLIAPIAVAAVDYQIIGRELLASYPRDRQCRPIVPSAALGTTQTLLASSVRRRRVESHHPWFVLPRDLFIAHSASGSPEPSSLRIRFGDAPSVAVNLDEPFFATGATCPPVVCSSPGQCQEPTELEVPFEVSFDLAGESHSVSGITKARCSGKPLPAPPPPPTGGPCNQWGCPPGIDCYNFEEPVVASIPHDAPWDEPGQGAHGALNVRIYPSTGTVSCDGDQSVASLPRPIVILDGFDTLNDRTHQDIWNDFGEYIAQLVALGFDVVAPDYQNGRDWIERNGYAVRELLVERMQEWATPEVLANDSVIVVGGSMGTQTGRWALRTAEIEGEDHNAGLFVAIDGPFRGANIPLAIQRLIYAFVEDAPAAEPYLDGIWSPAAKQQVRRSFDPTVLLPIYLPAPEFGAYYETVINDLGLPQNTRNVSLPSGSGTGTRYSNATSAKLFDIDIDVDFYSPLLPNSQASIRGYADGGAQNIFQSDAGILIAGQVPNSWPNWPGMQITDWKAVDTAAGGYRNTQKEVEDDLAGGLSFAFDTWIADGTADVDFDASLDGHAFIPTFSALDVGGVGATYVAADDPGISSATSFDSYFWEKCNQLHVSGMQGDAFGFLRNELVAFATGTVPEPVDPYEHPCGQPEDQDLCLGPVAWFENPASPFEILPVYDGTDCFVHDTPEGQTALVAANGYHVLPTSVACADGSTPSGVGCPYIEVPFGLSGPLGVAVVGNGWLALEFANFAEPGPEDCPPGTTFQQLEPDSGWVDGENLSSTLYCSIDPIPGVDPSSYYVDGYFTVMAPPAVECDVGYPAPVYTQWLCTLGQAPSGMEALLYDGAFYYDGYDQDCVPMSQPEACDGACGLVGDGCGGIPYWCGFCDDDGFGCDFPECYCPDANSCSIGGECPDGTACMW